MKIVFLGANNPQTIKEVNAQNRACSDFEVVGFLDNDPNKIGKSFYGFPVLGNLKSCRDLALNSVRFLNLITRDCPTRLITSREVAEEGGVFTNFIHPSIDLDMVTLGVGIYIQENVVLQAQAKIGNNTAINANSIVSHETQLGNSVFLAPGCHLAGCIVVEDGVFIGVGATVLPRLRIGKWSVIGGGSTVIRDVPPYSVVAGNPAKVIKTIEPVFDSGDIILASQA
jgi:sugar O-acyltransferase (sialic acid O-acetyltransferase NeuD family)